MQRIAIGIVMAIAVVALGACESAEKAPAAAAISAAQNAIDAVKGEAMKYVPDQVKSAQDAVATARASFEKKDYKAALASAQDATAKVKELGAAVATKKAELTKSWEEMSNGVPKMAEVIKSRVDILSQSKKLPAGVDRAKLDDAKAGLASVNENWAAASNAFKSGDMSDAVSKGKSAKDKAVEIMTALNMTVPQAATR
jgi:hypothetical protein